MYAVLGHTIAYKNALPYAGPIAGNKNAAIDAWRDFAINNGEMPDAVQEAADKLKVEDEDTLVQVYGGDEVVVVSRLHIVG